ncbi:hypothetical protein TR51_19590 [Kitasatospora griseola]|uniref:Uncharacterized protein n=1 Tax=Kitasatospora griseola TaxID=2064 RepID=A0A0D0N0G9_KITGR|nr:hypothetical protein [Kitasatospora griseola]KIQ61555.1 hypothetical protein TR51_19590 [Kitasatospora griseola]
MPATTPDQGRSSRTTNKRCAECVRLREQARAAVLTADRSRLSDVRVLERRHRDEAHGPQECAA